MSPAVSRNQKVAMIIAEKTKKGQVKPQKGMPSTKIANSMSAKQLGDFTGGSMKGLPKKVKQPKGY